jgi:hypothetical protein
MSKDVPRGQQEHALFQVKEVEKKREKHPLKSRVFILDAKRSTTVKKLPLHWTVLYRRCKMSTARIVWRRKGFIYCTE